MGKLEDLEDRVERIEDLLGIEDIDNGVSGGPIE